MLVSCVLVKLDRNTSGRSDITASGTIPLATDATERVLAAVKGLKDNFDKHYAQIESEVKKSVKGPVKAFTIDDDIPVVLFST